MFVPTDVEGGEDTVNLRQLLCEHDSLLLGLHKPGKVPPKIRSMVLFYSL